MIKVYRPLTPNEVFVIGADPAESRDLCSAVCISKQQADSPVVYNERVDSSQFGYELDKLGKFIHKQTGIYPTIGVERQQGQATIAKLLELNYPKLFRMKTFDLLSQKEEEKIGWNTSSATRIKMLDELSLAVKQRVHKIYDKETISQMLTFIRNKLGRPQAESGCFDDLVFAEAIGWQLYQVVPTESHIQWVAPPDDISNKDFSMT